MKHGKNGKTNSSKMKATRERRTKQLIKHDWAERNESKKYDAYWLKELRKKGTNNEEGD